MNGSPILDEKNDFVLIKKKKNFSSSILSLQLNIE